MRARRAGGRAYGAARGRRAVRARAGGEPAEPLSAEERLAAAKAYREEQRSLLAHLSGGQGPAIGPQAPAEAPPASFSAPPGQAPLPPGVGEAVQDAAAGAEGAAALRPEVQELVKRGRAKEVEIVSVDKGYKPKVTSWGMFPRPKNISEAYGGGRTIRPGEELEPAEAAKERERRIKASMQEYRKKAGIAMEDGAREEAERLLQDGKLAMAQGKLEPARKLLQECVDATGFRGDLGGQARLQLAICLDSQGRAEEAKELYVSLGRHPSTAVVKQANRMLFGMTTASEFMRAESFDYGVGNAYAEYFNRMVNPVFRASEEDEEDARQLVRQGIAAMLLVLTIPVGLIAGLAAGH